MFTFRWFIVVFLILPSLVWADEWSPIERAAKAIYTTSFHGNYVRQTPQGSYTYTISRIRQKNRVSDYASALDGNARAIVRRHNRVDFYATSKHDLPLLKTEYSAFFPDILPREIASLKSYYFLYPKEKDRIAGKECHWIWLIPYDVHRYMQGLCLSKINGLPLAHITKRADGKVVQSEVFVHIDFRVPTQDEMKLNNKLLKLESRMIEESVPSKINKNQRIKIPDGFFLQAYQQQKDYLNRIKDQYVLSDGLVHVSLFLETANQTEKEKALSLQGALSMAQTTRQNTKITAVGNMPPDGLRSLLHRVQFQ